MAEGTWSWDDIGKSYERVTFLGGPLEGEVKVRSDLLDKREPIRAYTPATGEVVVYDPVTDPDTGEFLCYALHSDEQFPADWKREREERRRG